MLDSGKAYLLGMDGTYRCPKKGGPPDGPSTLGCKGCQYNKDYFLGMRLCSHQYAGREAADRIRRAQEWERSLGF
jgi:hypothetical protein